MSEQQVVLQGELRNAMGKASSRRLRRLENKVPAIIYGEKKAPKTISLQHNKLIRALEDEAFYSSVFSVEIDGKQENVILKDLHRHPYKAQILHADLLRISSKSTITKNVPIHFLNEESAKGVKLGGSISHSMPEVEIKCLAKDLPAFIEVDMKDLGIEETLHLSDLVLPKGISLVIDASDKSHDLPVASIHASKVKDEEENDDSAPEAPSEEA
jgi:large subunit ribosomal protein L25